MTDPTPAAVLPLLAATGPGQSDLLIHFCGCRPGSMFTPTVPEDIKAMTPQQRLDAILRTQTLRAFVPFRASVPAVCLSESPGPHLLHLLTERGMPPWGIFLRRASVIAVGGGAIAYPPEPVHQQWPPEIQVWGNPIRADGRGVMDFTWEREWRIPLPQGGLSLSLGAVAAVLVGDPNWKPTPMATTWVHGQTGAPLIGPTIPEAIPLNHYPAAWTQAPHLYWNGSTLQHIP
ncbi:hypothetical protein [Nonomuraea candida]|uniref:hypothetical protein n=1 Tax=Nonomuraea candida TaxID=359159 RepID=UPI0005BB23F7|nr:hypothetical protein [Nonomuraea candida]